LSNKGEYSERETNAVVNGMKLPYGTLKLLGFNPSGDLGPLTAYTSRRHGTVWFSKSPPMKPPSDHQIRQRDRFRFAALAWRSLDDQTRQRWHDAARLARLIVHGYTLFIYWQLVRDRAALRTIELQSGCTLI